METFLLWFEKVGLAMAHELLGPDLAAGAAKVFAEEVWKGCIAVHAPDVSLEAASGHESQGAAHDIPPSDGLTALLPTEPPFIPSGACQNCGRVLENTEAPAVGSCPHCGFIGTTVEQK